jgi:hypothetical protein
MVMDILPRALLLWEQGFPRFCARRRAFQFLYHPLVQETEERTDAPCDAAIHPGYRMMMAFPGVSVVVTTRKMMYFVQAVTKMKMARVYRYLIGLAMKVAYSPA